MIRSLRGRTLLITGGSRGIGLAIALRAARDGANIAIAAKTTTPHPKLPGTIHTAAEEIRAAGGRALAVVCDVRDDAQVADAIASTVREFGGLDACVNNASAIRMTRILETPAKRFDLMHQINARGTFVVTQAAIPYLLRSDNPQLLSISPPLTMEERWFAPYVGYSMSKFGMSMVTLGVAGEYRGRIGVNALWPRTAIHTAAMAEFAPHIAVERLRSPAIMADAAWYVLTGDARTETGRFWIDDEVLAAHGIHDLSAYARPGVDELDLEPDIFVQSLRELRSGGGTHAREAATEARPPATSR